MHSNKGVPCGCKPLPISASHRAPSKSFRLRPARVKQFCEPVLFTQKKHTPESRKKQVDFPEFLGPPPQTPRLSATETGFPRLRVVESGPHEAHELLVRELRPRPGGDAVQGPCARRGGEAGARPPRQVWAGFLGPQQKIVFLAWWAENKGTPNKNKKRGANSGEEVPRENTAGGGGRGTQRSQAL